MNTIAEQFPYIQNWERLADIPPAKTFAGVKVSADNAENILPKPANQDTFVREKSSSEDAGIYKKPVQQTNGDAGAEIKSVQQMKYKNGSSVLHLDAVSDIPVDPKFNEHIRKESVLATVDPEAEKAAQKRIEAIRICNMRSKNVCSWNAKVEELKRIVKSQRLGYAGTEKLFKKGYADWLDNLKKTDLEAYNLWIDDEQEIQELQAKSKR